MIALIVLTMAASFGAWLWAGYKMSMYFFPDEEWNDLIGVAVGFIIWLACWLQVVYHFTKPLFDQ